MDASSHSPASQGDGAAGLGPRGRDCGSPPAGATVLGWLGVLARGPSAGSHTDPFHLRRWFVAFLLWLAVLTVIGVVSFARHEGGVSGARGVWLVSLALFYLSLCCIFLPAPTAWIVRRSTKAGMTVRTPVLRVRLIPLCSSARNQARRTGGHCHG